MLSEHKVNFVRKFNQCLLIDTKFKINQFLQKKPLSVTSFKPAQMIKSIKENL